MGEVNFHVLRFFCAFAFPSQTSSASQAPFRLWTHNAPGVIELTALRFRRKAALVYFGIGKINMKFWRVRRSDGSQRDFARHADFAAFLEHGDLGVFT